MFRWNTGLMITTQLETCNNGIVRKGQTGVWRHGAKATWGLKFCALSVRRTVSFHSKNLNCGGEWEVMKKAMDFWPWRVARTLNMPGQQGLRASILSLGLEKDGLFPLWNTVETQYQPLCAIIATLNYPVWIKFLRKRVVKCMDCSSWGQWRALYCKRCS